MISGKPFDHPSVRGLHTVAMTRDYPDGKAVSVATCACGWCASAPATPEGYCAQDDAIEAHWFSIIAAAEETAA